MPTRAKTLSKAKASTCAVRSMARQARKAREAKEPERGRRFPSPRNVSPSQMLLRRRILLPATIRRAITRQESAGIAARAMIAARAVATTDKGTIAVADAAGAGDGVAVEAEEEAAATGVIKAGAICLHRNTPRRRASEIIAAMIIAARRA